MPTETLGMHARALAAQEVPMRTILNLVKREPAMLVALILALVNLVWSVTEEQAVQIAALIETLVVLVSGAVVRSQVTPVAAPNLPPSRRG
jgi:hypothetical protein